MTTSILRCTLLAAMLSTFLYGQSDVARIVGTIKDSSGAVIPSAAVTIKNESNGQGRKVVVNEQGQYVAAQLPPAPYTVTAEAAGMAPAEFNGIRLQVGQERIL